MRCHRRDFGGRDRVGESDDGLLLRLFPALREELPHLLETECPQHDGNAEHDVPEGDDGVLRDREGRDVVARGVPAQRGNVEGLGLTDPTGGDREKLGEHVGRRNEKNGEQGDRYAERRHENDVDADPAAERGARGQCHLPRVAPLVPEDRGPCLALCQKLRSRGFRRGQRRTTTAIATTTTIGTRSGCDAKKPPVSFEGEPFDTLRGRTIASTMSISTLTAVKNSDWTTVAEATPATVEPGMLVRKMPIIVAVPAWAGVTALIAVPPCDAPQAVLNDSPPPGYAA